MAAKTATQIRLDEYNYEKLKKIADRELRSLNAQMEYFIYKAIEAYEAENGTISTSFDEPPLQDWLP